MRQNDWSSMKMDQLALQRKALQVLTSMSMIDTSPTNKHAPPPPLHQVGRLGQVGPLRRLCYGGHQVSNPGGHRVHHYTQLPGRLARL